jgi:hypothetical protein
MGLWKTRHHSMEMLAKDFKKQARAIEKTFLIVDECIDLFNDKAGDDDFHRICCLVLAKARNYALGSYGLVLDGLGQEAGALLRPFIEYHELLTYFRLEPNRVQQAIDDKLPSAGKRAQLIAGNFHEFRKYLNDNASHSSFSYHALNHLLDKPDMTIRKEQPMLPKVLFKNMGDFFVQMILMAIEAINCLQTAKMGCAEMQAENIEQLRIEGIEIFKLNERASTSA